MTDSLQVNKRRVYSAMIFFGDVGGLYSAVFALGAALHFFLVGENLAKHRKLMARLHNLTTSIIKNHLLLIGIPAKNKRALSKKMFLLRHLLPCNVPRIVALFCRLGVAVALSLRDERVGGDALALRHSFH